ncbi:MAG: hypothetical protein FJW38_05815 [Acidobacteria bacterium]|nr:hypothetical protein [Acidobacteriota bacterium]
MSYTQAEIDELISCQKTISDPPKRDLKPAGAHSRNDMRLVASGLDGEFTAFMRRSIDFPENFFIGLIYDPKNGTGEITLIRCNGLHGVFGGSFDPDHPHWGNHIHRATEANIAAGLRPERHAVSTDAYASFEEALQHFVKLINFSPAQANEYFPSDAQSTFPFQEGGN